jgi:hypothetical protein
LAAGPARITAARCHSGRRLSERSTSAGGVSSSGFSSIIT